mgnify:CR=1 FL=1
MDEIKKDRKKVIKGLANKIKLNSNIVMETMLKKTVFL